MPEDWKNWLYLLLFEGLSCQPVSWPFWRERPAETEASVETMSKGTSVFAPKGWTGDPCEITTKSSVTSSSKAWQKYLSVASSLSCVLGYVSATLLATVIKDVSPKSEVSMPLNWFELCITAAFATNNVPEPNFSYLYLDYNNYYW